MILHKQSVDDILKEGIYGPKEIKPEEKRKFLGTFRERVLIALSRSQVREREIYPQVEEQMKENSSVRLLLNGNIDYESLSKYVKLAQNHHIEYTIVTNKEQDTDIGLVLAMDHAIDKEDIYVVKKEPALQQAQNGGKEKSSIFAKLFKRVWGS